MLFSSGTFIFLFLPISLIGYQLLSYLGRRALLLWLSFASLFFYGYWNPKYLILLVSSIILNFIFSIPLGREEKSESARSRWLFGAIAANLMLLGWFKYLFPVLGFFNRYGLIHRDFGDAILPLGISFFTFTQIAYLIDVRQNVSKPQGLLTYTVFVTFFPHLIAGPIIHPREILPQIEGERLRGLKLDNIALGLTWFVLGLGKKVLIADHVAPLANALYSHPRDFGFIAAWLGSLCYAMQLYFDFSGYSDMALGLARMFSIQFPINFDSPYKSSSIITFWTRWHMTLSRYLAEYLYTPILRSVNSRRMDKGKKVSRKAQATPEGFIAMVFFPLMATMFLAGVWHGAGLQFLAFGILHGLYLVINHAWRLLTPKGHPLHGKLPVPIGVLLTFLAVLAGQVFFRAADFRGALYILGTLIGVHGVAPSFTANPWILEIPASSAFLVTPIKASMTVALCLLVVWTMPNTQEILGQIGPESIRLPSLLPKLTWRPTAAWCIALAIIFSFSVLNLDSTVQFLYFQF